MAARLLSRAVCHFPLFCLTRTAFRNITRNNLKNTFPLLYSGVFNLPTTTARVDSTRTRRQSQTESVFLVMVGGFALGSQDDEMDLTEGQVTPEIQPPSGDKNGRFTRKEREGGKKLIDKTRGIRDWRAKRKIEFEDSEEKCSPPKKRETRASQVWLKRYFCYLLHQTTH